MWKVTEPFSKRRKNNKKTPEKTLKKRHLVSLLQQHRQRGWRQGEAAASAISNVHPIRYPGEQLPWKRQWEVKSTEHSSPLLSNSILAKPNAPFWVLWSHSQPMTSPGRRGGERKLLHSIASIVIN